MIYTSNLQLQLSEVSTYASSSLYTTTHATAMAVLSNNLFILDFNLAGYYLYNILSDANINITTESMFIEITDTSILLTANRTISITDNPVRMLRIIKNNTLFTITYGSQDIPSSKTCILYNDSIISGKGNTGLLDIYTYISDKPAINTILMLKRPAVASLLIGGSAKASIAATSALTMDIWFNTTIVGSINFIASSTVGTITIFGAVYLNTTDRLYIKTRGTQDSTLANIGIVLNITGE